MGNCCSDTKHTKIQDIKHNTQKDFTKIPRTQTNLQKVQAGVTPREDQFQNLMKTITQTPIGQVVYEDSEISSRKSDNSSYQSEAMNETEKRQVETAFEQSKINKKKKVGDYDVEKVLTRGAFGEINLELSLKGVKYVGKIIPVNRKNREHEKEQAKILKGFNHKNIAQVKDFFLLDKDQYLAIVYEYCQGGSLHQMLGQLEKPKIQTIMYQIVEAFQYLHRKDIVHRDLRLENIFLDKDNHIKVGNFGQIRSMKSRQSPVVGVNSYMALEVLMGFTYGKQADIWAMGIIFIELILGKRIWVLVGNQQPSTRTDFPSSRILDAIDNKLWRNLIQSMLDKQSKDRPTIAQIIKCLKGEINSPRKQKVGRVQYTDGYYEGELLNGIPEGNGTYYWKNGNKYEGQWKNKQLYGRGVASYANGDKYDGEWKDGCMNGWGIYYNANGSRFEGQLEDGILTGKGTIYYIDGDSYSGHFKDSRKHGSGIETIKGSKFEVKYKMDKCIKKIAL